MSQAQDLMESTLLASGVVTAVNTGAVGSSGNHLLKIVNIFDGRHEKIVNQRWTDIVSIKEEHENLDQANRRIEIVNTAFSLENLLLRSQRKQVHKSFVTLTHISSILARNQNKLINILNDAEENWTLLKMHLIHGWKGITDYHLNREKQGLSMVSRVLKKNRMSSMAHFFKNLTVGKEYDAHLAYMEKRFGMAAGELEADMWGHYTFDEDGKIEHVESDQFLGLDGLRRNHGILLLQDYQNREDSRGQSEFFDKVFEYIRVKEFSEKLDVMWHRAKARKGINAMRNNWISRIHSNNKNLSKISNLLNNQHEKLKSQDFDNFMKMRKEKNKGTALQAGALKLRDLFNKDPNRSLRSMGKNQSMFKDQKGKELEIVEGDKILKNYQNNLKNWANCKLKMAFHSGLLMHNDFLTRKLHETKKEHAQKCIQEASQIMGGTVKRHVRNDMNHFLIRLLNKDLVLNRVLLGDKRLRATIKMNRYINARHAFESMKLPKKAKKKSLDPAAVEELVDALKYLIDNRKSQGFGSIQSYVMEFEVLKIEEISNNMEIDNNVRNMGEAYSRMKGAQAQAEMITSKYLGDKYIFSNNSMESDADRSRRRILNFTNNQDSDHPSSN